MFKRKAVLTFLDIFYDFHKIYAQLNCNLVIFKYKIPQNPKR